MQLPGASQGQECEVLLGSDGQNRGRSVTPLRTRLPGTSHLLWAPPLPRAHTGDQVFGHEVWLDPATVGLVMEACPVVLFLVPVYWLLLSWSQFPGGCGFM